MKQNHRCTSLETQCVFAAASKRPLHRETFIRLSRNTLMTTWGANFKIRVCTSCQLDWFYNCYCIFRSELLCKMLKVDKATCSKCITAVLRSAQQAVSMVDWHEDLRGNWNLPLSFPDCGSAFLVDESQPWRPPSCKNVEMGCFYAQRRATIVRWNSINVAFLLHGWTQNAIKKDCATVERQILQSTPCTRDRCLRLQRQTW